MVRPFVIWGGYGGHNLGDEAILWALSRQLRRQEPETRQIVLIPGGVSDVTQSQYAAWGIEVHSGTRPFVYRILFRARLVVGGGQMVDDCTPGWPVGWTSVLILINRLLGGTSIILCIGAEPLRRRLARMLVSRVYSLAQVCTCRDDASAELLIDAGVPKDKIRVTRDVVFSLDPAILPRWQPGKPGVSVKVAILVAYDPKRIRENTARLRSLVEVLLQKNISVILVAHDLREGYDRIAVGEIASKFPGHPFLSTFKGNRLEDVMSLYSECDAVISGRMHPLILASLVGTLPIAFGGKAKVQSLLKISSIPALADASPQQYAEEIFELMARRDQIQQQLQQQIRCFSADVEQSIAQALSLIAKR